MNRIEIVALYNGSHRNQKFNGVLPDGWAVDLNDLCRENFPFGEVEAEKINGIMTVTKWIPGTAPEPIEEEQEYQPTELEQLRADVDYIAVMTGVEL